MAPAADACPRQRIALIEDDDTLALLLQYNLEAAGFAVDRIVSGAAALARLRSDPPDAVLLDWMLPGVSGIEILRQIRLGIATRTLPVVMLTCRVDDEDRRRALETGADAFIGKPFSVSFLMTTLRSLLVTQQAMLAPR